MRSLSGLDRFAISLIAGATLVGLLAGCVAEDALREPGAPSSMSGIASPSIFPAISPTATAARPTVSSPPTVQPDPTTPLRVTDVKVTIVTLDYVGDGVEASGIIPSIIEEGGSCVLTLTRGDTILTSAGPASAATEATFCGLLAIKDGRLSPGTWSATVAYASNRYTGVSDILDVEVPE